MKLASLLLLPFVFVNCFVGAQPFSAPPEDVQKLLTVVIEAFRRGNSVVRYGHTHTELSFLDQPTSVQLVGGIPAFTAVIRQTRWIMNEGGVGQFPDPSYDRRFRDAVNLPEEKRAALMQRSDNHTQLWLIPQGVSFDSDHIKNQLIPRNLSHQHQREIAYLGKGHGFAWFAFMPIASWVSVQSGMNLSGGDDPLAAMVRGLRVKSDATIDGAFFKQTQIPDATAIIPYLKRSAIESAKYSGPVDGCSVEIAALGRIRHESAGLELVSFATGTNEALAIAAQQWLIENPRREADEFYLKWLEANAGKREVNSVLAYFQDNQPSKIAPVLPRVLASPQSAKEYCLAFEISRGLRGLPAMPPELARLSEQIRRESRDPKLVADSVERLIHADDVESAAVIGLKLATASSKGGLREINAAGAQILKELPKGYGVELVRSILKSRHDLNDPSRLNAVLEP